MKVILNRLMKSETFSNETDTANEKFIEKNLSVLKNGDVLKW